MKKVIFILLIPFLFAFTCEEEKEEKQVILPSVKSNELLGKWQLIETLEDPGDGSGTFQPVVNGKIIEFIEDNTIANLDSPFSCNSPDINLPIIATYSEKDKKITFSDCPDFSLGVEIKNGNLFLYPPCIEACASKYKKI